VTSFIRCDSQLIELPLGNDTNFSSIGENGFKGASACLKGSRS
jgi:hypothetical protein